MYTYFDGLLAESPLFLSPTPSFFSMDKPPLIFMAGGGTRPNTIRCLLTSPLVVSVDGSFAAGGGFEAEDIVSLFDG